MFHSEPLESVLERGLYETEHDPGIQGYEFNNIKLVVAQLFEVKDAHGLERQLKKLAYQNGGTDITFRLDHFKDAFAGDTKSYSMNIGTLLLQKGKAARLFKSVHFEAEVVNSTYFMLYSSFMLAPDTSEMLNDARNKRQIIGSVGFTITRWAKRLRLNHNYSYTYKNLFPSVFAGVAGTANKFLGKYLSRPLNEVYGLATLYRTNNSIAATWADFGNSSIGHLPIHNKSEFLFIENESPHLRILLKTADLQVQPGTPNYPNHLVDDFGPIFLYEALVSYVGELQKEANLITRKLAGHTFTNGPRLSKLNTYNNALIIQRYHIRSIENLLQSPAWGIYVNWARWKGTALKRMDKNYNNEPFNYDKSAKNRLNSEIAASKQLLDNALSRVSGELSAKNTSSNNRLSWIILGVSLIGLAVAMTAIFTELYPDRSKQWLCQKGVVCIKDDSKEKDT